MLFPGSRCLGARTREIDLGDFFRRQAPTLDMTRVKQQDELLAMASEGGRTCTYGSFLEDRTHLWAGLYPTPPKSKLVHLGVDINNVVVGQPVASLTDGTIFHVLEDYSARTGWGGRVVVRSPTDKGPIFLMYAHLGRSLPPVGTPVERGQIIGSIGDPRVNGGWFPHLHLQIMSEKYIRNYEANLDEIDGYATSPASFTPTKIRSMLKRDGLIDPLEFVAAL
jgi:murein DD-endopeptidase MepM/ murein hydrolase activator NlpD